MSRLVEVLVFRTRIITVVAMLAIGVPTGLPAGAGGDAELHCLVFVVGQRASGEFIVTTPDCYSSFQEAIAVASSGLITVAEAPTIEELFADPETVLASFTLGTHFEGSNGSGSSISVVGSSCTGGYWNTGPSWANRISSSWNGCHRLRHHDGPNKTGTYADTVGSGTHNLPSVMNNKTESVSYWGS